MKLTKNALRCSIAAAAIAVSSMAAATPTMAQNGASAEKTYTFSIPAQDMKSALRAFARVGNLLDQPYIGSVIVNDGNQRYYEPGPDRSFTVGLQWQWAR